MPNVAPLHATDPRRVGHYRLTGRIAEMPAEGPVFLAATENQNPVTLTLLDADWTHNGAARDRFTAEARAARRVAPFCTARIIDAGLDDGLAYLVREYVAGPSLTEFVADRGPLRDRSLTALAVGTATGLAAIHQAGLVHGQFGPEHVVLGLSGPRVVGFGVTPPYGSATPAADMLAWGRTILFAATGWAKADDWDLAALSEPLRGVVARSIGREPGGRPPARTAVLELLGDDQSADPLAEGSRLAVSAAYRPPAEPAPEPAGEPPQAAARRSGAIWWVVGIMACVVAIAVAVHVLQNQGSGPAPSGRRASAAQPPAGSSGRNRSSPSTSASATAAGSIPGSLAGSWSGQANQQTDVFTVHVKLVKGASTGSIRYSGVAFSCTGLLSVMADAGGALTMHQGITVGRRTCANGLVTLRPEASGSLLFKFTGAAGPAAEGSLTRQ
jgi:serine/threonine protein kinase